MKPKLNDTVRLLEEIPEDFLARGAVGVVVGEFSEPEEAYEVEFADQDGATIAQLALRPSQFCVVE